MLHTPDLIIADEPTTALDVTIQAQILSEVQNLARRNGTALIWITHDLSIVAGLADQIAVMYAGRIVEQGNHEDLIAAKGAYYRLYQSQFSGAATDLA
jgi:peptide/nickel transport system ATP-binding protein